MVGEVRNVARLDAQVPEGLGFGVNDLVHELALDLVGRESVPPQCTVKKAGHGLQDSLGYVDMASLLENLLIHKGGDLGQRILLGTVQLVRLANRRLVVQHLFQGCSHIDGLGNRYGVISTAGLLA